MNNVPPKGLYRFLGRWDDFDIAFIFFCRWLLLLDWLEKIEKKSSLPPHLLIIFFKSPKLGQFLKGKMRILRRMFPFIFIFCILVKFRTKKMLPSQGLCWWRICDEKKGAREPFNRLVWRKMSEVATFRGKKEMKLAIFSASVLVTSTVHSGVLKFCFSFVSEL